MAYGVKITGLAALQQRFGQSAEPAIRSGVKAVALEVQAVMAPYPPATIANSPANPTGRWYQRGYGPKWWVMGEGAREYLFGARARNIKTTGVGGITKAQVRAAARRGMIHGRATSQMMNRGWSVKPSGPIGWILGNRADYSGYLHRKEDQVRWAGPRGWITEVAAMRRVIDSGAVQRIFGQALAHLYRRGS